MKFLFAIFFFGASLLANAQPKSDNPLQPIEFLIGAWQQKTENSTVVHTYQFVLGNKLLSPHLP